MHFLYFLYKMLIYWTFFDNKEFIIIIYIIKKYTFI